MAKLLIPTDFISDAAYAEYITQLHYLAVRCDTTGYCNSLDALAIEAYSSLVDTGYFDRHLTIVYSNAEEDKRVSPGMEDPRLSAAKLIIEDEWIDHVKWVEDGETVYLYPHDVFHSWKDEHWQINRNVLSPEFRSLT